LVGIFDYMRYAYLGVGEFNLHSFLYPTGFAIVVLAFGVLVFNKVQKTFMDTV
jgi:lipopolysaccharide transport system permease protein